MQSSPLFIYCQCGPHRVLTSKVFHVCTKVFPIPLLLSKRFCIKMFAYVWHSDFFPTSKKRKGMNSIRNQWGCKAFQQTNRLLSLFILLTDVRSNSVGKKHFNPHNFRGHFLTYMKTKWGNFLATVFEFVHVHSV